MADIIQLLPDSIVNQIAAGEVVQRPASVVKELMENSIDAGATSIKLIIKDSGKTLIQVIDNGCGMSGTDARLSFALHATSKIRAADDLFSIRTMGFRGEALASIAAVSQVEMRTRLQKNELGTRIVIEGSDVLTQEPCQCTAGTNIMVKNLFYNVPARRNFLKSNAIEMRHVLDEFQRLALANTDVFFSLHHNGTEIMHLPASNLRQRIVGIFGNASNQKLVPVKEETDVMSVTGFIGKPEFARKMRGEQLFFVNHRFIKSGYLHHAVMSAFEDLLPKDTFPFYALFIEMDPSKININVHPTKQEIKFDDERLVYNYLKVAIRHALGQYSITPSIDFEQETSFSPTNNHSSPFGNLDQEEMEREMSESVGSTGGKGSSSTSNFRKQTRDADQANATNWQKLFEGLEEFEAELEGNQNQTSDQQTLSGDWAAPHSGNLQSHQANSQREPCQIHNSYIVSQIKSGFLLIDQQAAHERILFERYLEILESAQGLTQKELFPRTLNLSTADTELMREMMPSIQLLGFDIQEFGLDTFIIYGVPADLRSGSDETKILESLLEQFRENRELNMGLKENIAQSMAKSAAITHGQGLTGIEMRELIDKLFACSMPFKSPSGRNCFLTFDLEELKSKFKA